MAVGMVKNPQKFGLFAVPYAACTVRGIKLVRQLLKSSQMSSLQALDDYISCFASASISLWEYFAILRDLRTERADG